MTAQPESLSLGPDQLREPLTVAGFMAIDGADHPSLELQEGSLVMSPFASPAHMFAMEDGEVTGVCTVDGPFPVRLRLDELAR